ncbi:hypothetical protein GG344DRAFT_77340 [Lentinula edodes]|nr:hypothetical protein GG344DRAFT_77340 [Lentinula edodes]
MLNLWSPLAISTVRAAPLSLNETLIGRMVDGDNNPSHAALLEGCNDPHPLAIRGEGQSKVDRGKDKGKKAHSQSSNNAIEPIPVYFFDCGSIVPFQGATLKPGYLYKSAWYLELDPDHPSVFRPQCRKKYRVTKYWLAPQREKLLDLRTYPQSDANQVSMIISTNMEIQAKLEKLKKLKKSSKLPGTLRQHKETMDAYDVVIMREPSGETLYAALLNDEGKLRPTIERLPESNPEHLNDPSVATRLPTLKYDQHHEAEYLENAWKVMKHAEGYSGSAVASDNDGDWSTDQ